MRFYIDSNSRVTAWSLDGQPLDPAPAGTTAVDVSQEIFAPLVAARAPCKWTGTRIVPLVAPSGRFMQALVQMHWHGTLKGFVDAYPAPKGDELRVLWLHSVEFLRNDADLVAVAHAAGMSDTDIDDVFVLAAQLDREEL